MISIALPLILLGFATCSRGFPNEDVIQWDVTGSLAAASGTPGILFTPESGLVTNENGRSDSFTVRLNAAPSSPVKICLSSSNPNEALIAIGGSVLGSDSDCYTARIEFTTSNWSSAQTVTVQGVNDGSATTVPFSIASTIVSTDSGYSSLSPPPVAGTNYGFRYHIFVTSNSYPGNLRGVTGADTKCMGDALYPGYGTFKAIISDDNGTTYTRRACGSNANCTTLDPSWILRANTSYFRTDEVTLIGTTNAGGIFPFPLTNSFAPSGQTYWTGLQGDWTTNAAYCDATSGWDGSKPTTYGDSGLGSATDGGAIYTGSPVGCNNSLYILCAEQ